MVYKQVIERRDMGNGYVMYRIYAHDSIGKPLDDPNTHVYATTIKVDCDPIRATGCTCPSYGPCYHKNELTLIEQGVRKGYNLREAFAALHAGLLDMPPLPQEKKPVATTKGTLVNPVYQGWASQLPSRKVS